MCKLYELVFVWERIDFISTSDSRYPIFKNEFKGGVKLEELKLLEYRSVEHFMHKWKKCDQCITPREFLVDIMFPCES